MFIYKITVLPINKIYFGLDTKPEYKMARWKDHLRYVKRGSSRKIHEAIRTYGLENCHYEVVESGFDNMVSLALAEINYIKKYDTYVNGLNSSLGGDGIGKHDLSKFTNDEINDIKQSLGNHWTNYNKIKWKNTTVDERREMMNHLYDAEIIEKRVKTQKDYYNTIPNAREKHSKGLAEWRKNNPEESKRNSEINGLLGAEKISKKVIVEKENGTIEEYKSVSEFQRKTGQWMITMKEKSKKNQFHNGYKLKGFK